MLLHMELGEKSYPITVEAGSLGRAGEILGLGRRVLIVTDDGVPPVYARTLAASSAHPVVVTVPRGEGSKSIARFEQLLRVMLENGFTRSDCAAAVGGGVVGDLTGFAASAYMRGIDFYNVPTTLLSQVDSSIGGKTAVNLGGIKNPVGAFWQPKAVLIDPETLGTLPPRQLASGMAEAVKMALCFDEAGVRLFEEYDPAARLGEIIGNALKIKKCVVEEDETERGLRRALNFGHTLGHGIESAGGTGGLPSLLHGECVALGMLPMCSDKVRARLLPILRKLELPVTYRADGEQTGRIMEAVLHDKKAAGGRIRAVTVEEAGTFEFRDMTAEELCRRFTACFGIGGELT